MVRKVFQEDGTCEKGKAGRRRNRRGADLPVGKAENTAKILLREMNAKPAITVYSQNTNEILSVDDEKVMEGIEKMALALNRE